MKKTLTTIGIGIALAISAGAPIIPQDVRNATWKESYEVPGFNTSTGMLGETDYAVDGNRFLIAGEDGLTKYVDVLPVGKVTQKQQTDNIFVHLYEKKDKTYYVVSKDRLEYEGLRNNGRPSHRENVSVLELLFEPHDVQAEIEIDDFSRASLNGTAASATFAHTVNSANEVLILAVSVQDAGGDEPQSATYDGVALTQQVTNTHSGNTTMYTGIWYLVNPSTGTNNIFVDLTQGATADDHFIVVWGLTGADTTTVFDDSEANEFTGVPSITLTHTPGAFMADVITSNGAAVTAHEQGAEQTRMSALDYGSYTAYSSDVYLRSSGNSLSVASQDGTPNGLFVRSDGLKMYMSGTTNDRVYQYTLTTAWDLATATYDSVSYSVATQETSPTDISFKPDGTKMFILGLAGDAVYEYALSSAWDVSSATFTASSSVAAQETSAHGFYFKPDGTKMYVGGTFTDKVYQYTLATPWDISTASYDTVSYSPSVTGFLDIDFNSDGTIIYIDYATEENLVEYSLGTAWDLSSASATAAKRVVNDAATSETAATAWAINPDDSRIFLVGTGQDTIYEYKPNTTATSTVMTWTEGTGTLLVSQSAVAVRPAPWIKTYTYCREMTMTAGGNSGGVATTTTAGFPLVATSTITDLKSTTHGGKVQVVTNDKPIDVVFTSGTNCLTDNSPKIDHYFESYASTTGAFAVWTQPTDIASTTAKSVLMYYGNASGTDQQDKAGVWDANNEVAIYNLDETDIDAGAGDIKDATASYNLTTQNMESADAVTGYLGGAFNFDGTDEAATGAHMTELRSGSITFSVWVRPDNVLQNYWIMNQWTSVPSISGPALFHRSTGDLAWEVGSSFLDSVGTMTNGRWYHIVGVAEEKGASDTWSIYINGALDISSAVKVNTYGTVQTFELSTAATKGSVNSFDGILDDARVYNTAVHAMDILTIYNNTKDSSTFWTFGAEETESVSSSAGAGVDNVNFFE